MMNKIALFLFFLIFGLIIKTNVFSAENNPNRVAYYSEGIHAIPTNPTTYLTGTNLVTRRVNTGQIQAWYTGADGSGFYSVWNITNKLECPEKWVYFADPYPEWGDYLSPDSNYCVHVKAY